jgi:hypothetical protein
MIVAHNAISEAEYSIPLTSVGLTRVWDHWSPKLINASSNMQGLDIPQNSMIQLVIDTYEPLTNTA